MDQAISEVILGWKWSSVESQVDLEWRRYNENILSMRHRCYRTAYVPSLSLHSCCISRCEKVKQVNLKFLTDSNREVYPNSYVCLRLEGETTNKPFLEIPSSLLLLPDSYGVLMCAIDLVRNDPPWLENNSNFASKHVLLPSISIDLVDRLWVQSPRCFSLVDEEVIKGLPCMGCSSSNEFLLYKMNFDTLAGGNTTISGYPGISTIKTWVKNILFVALHDRDKGHGRETSVPSIIIIASTAGFVSLFSWSMSHHRAGTSVFHYMEYFSLGTTEVLDNKVKHRMDLIKVPLMEMCEISGFGFESVLSCCMSPWHLIVLYVNFHGSKNLGRYGSSFSSYSKFQKTNTLIDLHNHMSNVDFMKGTTVLVFNLIPTVGSHIYKVIEIRNEQSGLINDFSGKFKRDERKIPKRELWTGTVALDTSHNYMDENTISEKGAQDVYGTFHLLLRRNPRENNFKHAFLDADHSRTSFTDYQVCFTGPDGNKVSHPEPPFRLKFLKALKISTPALLGSREIAAPSDVHMVDACSDIEKHFVDAENFIIEAYKPFKAKFEDRNEKSQHNGFLSSKVGSKQTALLDIAFPDNFDNYYERGKVVTEQSDMGINIKDQYTDGGRLNEFNKNIFFSLPAAATTLVGTFLDITIDARRYVEVRRLGWWMLFQNINVDNALKELFQGVAQNLGEAAFHMLVITARMIDINTTTIEVNLCLIAGSLDTHLIMI
ncbi:hypothetical protein MKW92_042482 [Papaver armeniacum]|nr:hypothetical protein MKW92_042482 [Papaver armeniacum]